MKGASHRLARTHKTVTYFEHRTRRDSKIFVDPRGCKAAALANGFAAVTNTDTKRTVAGASR